MERTIAAAITGPVSGVAGKASPLPITRVLKRSPRPKPCTGNRMRRVARRGSSAMKAEITGNGRRRGIILGYVLDKAGVSGNTGEIRGER